MTPCITLHNDCKSLTREQKDRKKTYIFFFLNEAYMLSIRHFDLSKTLLTKKDTLYKLLVDAPILTYVYQKLTKKFVKR